MIQQTEEKTTSHTVQTPRPPIVVVVGHVDHGKTTILDFYRKTKVAQKESGGITQHIGAYQIEHPSSGSGQGRKITFIDTPGHEAFSKMRSRGARVADIAVLVVAADEGVKAQTREAIATLREAGIPYVVALSKTDKPEANPERVKAELAENGVLVEGYGGSIPSVAISAAASTNMDELLEVLLLVADLEPREAKSGEPAEGVVIETRRDSRRGNTATLLVREGALRKKDVLVFGSAEENIRILEDFAGMPIERAGASSPVLVAGLSRLPEVGQAFRAFAERSSAQRFVQSLPAEEQKTDGPFANGGPPASGAAVGKPVFNIIIRADVAGSGEAVRDLLQNIESESVGINILASGTGDVTESDIKTALATKLVTIVAFRARVGLPVRELAEKSNIRIVVGEVIYDLVDRVKAVIEEMIPPEIRRIDLGKVKILKIFKQEGTRRIAGGRVEEGVARKDMKCEIKRFREVVGVGAILQVQQERNVVHEAAKGSECGLLIESKTSIQEGDVLEVYQEEVIRKKL